MKREWRSMQINFDDFDIKAVWNPFDWTDALSTSKQEAKPKPSEKEIFISNVMLVICGEWEMG